MTLLEAANALMRMIEDGTLVRRKLGPEDKERAVKFMNDLCEINKAIIEAHGVKYADVVKKGGW